MTMYVLLLTGEVTREQGRHAGDLITILGGRMHGRFVAVEGPAAYWFSIDPDHEKSLRDVLRSEWGGDQKVRLTWLTVSQGG